MNSSRSWLVFIVGVFAYAAAVTQRTSLGVAGVAAVDRFDASAAALSTMAVVQLVVYAAAQVPVGILIDRWGPRILIVSGLSFMAVGQVVLALAPSIGLAVVGRLLVGIGDAAIFVSAIRLVSSWFSGRIVPQLSQWTGNIGQLGQVVSAVPFAFVLNTYGWVPAFVSAAAFAALALVLAFACIRDRPAASTEQPRIESWRGALRQLRESLRRPGTQLGFWSHFITQSSANVFALLWGYPFMVYGLGYSTTLASTLLVVLVVSAMIVGPIIGLLSARFPYRRSNIILGITVAMSAAWGTIILWPGQPPLAIVIVFVVIIAIGGPGSVIGFDFARTFNPLRALGSANGVVNIGGFFATFVMVFSIGWVLDLVSGGVSAQGAPYDLQDFKFAFLMVYPVIIAGLVMLLRARRRTRRRIIEDDGIQVAPLWIAALRKIRERRA